MCWHANSLLKLTFDRGNFRIFIWFFRSQSIFRGLRFKTFQNPTHLSIKNILSRKSRSETRNVSLPPSTKSPTKQSRREKLSRETRNFLKSAKSTERFYFRSSHQLCAVSIVLELNEFSFGFDCVEEDHKIRRTGIFVDPRDVGAWRHLRHSQQNCMLSLLFGYS